MVLRIATRTKGLAEERHTRTTSAGKKEVEEQKLLLLKKTRERNTGSSRLAWSSPTFFEDAEENGTIFAVGG